MIDLIDLRAFARIADLKSISAAARALQAPKSSVSRSLARLEKAVGAVLIERSTRHLRLTDAGTLFHRHALRLGRAADNTGLRLLADRLPLDLRHLRPRKRHGAGLTRTGADTWFFITSN